jgi:hypothetical protein
MPFFNKKKKTETHAAQTTQSNQASTQEPFLPTTETQEHTPIRDARAEISTNEMNRLMQRYDTKAQRIEDKAQTFDQHLHDLDTALRHFNLQAFRAKPIHNDNYQLAFYIMRFDGYLEKHIKPSQSLKTPKPDSNPLLNPLSYKSEMLERVDQLAMERTQLAWKALVKEARETLYRNEFTLSDWKSTPKLASVLPKK